MHSDNRSTHRHAWQPYNRLPANPAPLKVVRTHGHHLQLADGQQLLDGIASWWTAIFGYNHPALVDRIHQQSQQLAHVMFGGLSHPTAEALAEQLAQQLPDTPAIFFSDSGSVAVEVALKMAKQYWLAQGKTEKQRFVALKQGYHGDTWGAMSVSDPDSLHQGFRNASQQTLFAPAPNYGFNTTDNDDDINALEAILAEHHTQLAAVILEPIWQGAGAMNFYRPAYLRAVRQLCDQYQLLLIVDEIATGFGKTGQYFAFQHANIAADLVCIGKALTGGMLTLAATCASQHVADVISDNAPNKFMHGPTYMANALACASALTSLQLMQEIDWQTRVARWQASYPQLDQLSNLPTVKAVRYLGHAAIIEMHNNAQAAAVQPIAQALGIYIRPFANWVYLTPAYTMSPAERQQLIGTLILAVEKAASQPHRNQPSAVI